MMIPKIVASIAPGICLIAYFYLKDKDEPEPLKLIFRMFLLGAIFVFPLIVVQGLLNIMMPGVILQSFLVSGFTEEFIKWLIIYFFIYSHAEFDEHFDGIVYAVAVAGGYATVENLFYIFLNKGDVGILIWIRAFLPVSAHVLFGVTMGYYFGKAKQTRLARYLFIALLLPALFHGMFNSLILVSFEMAGIVIVLYMLFLWGYNIKKMNAAQRQQNRIGSR
ncbi:glutamic-type intramembrane protease PrsW [Paenibacillus sp. GYB004]|uniref:glutamic-type intramembrane protease PrsW n=1 Tax=Paenibacillus sp. GYB004 TaxID=2994393 RepID=UPI002F96B107